MLSKEIEDFQEEERALFAELDITVGHYGDRRVSGRKARYLREHPEMGLFIIINEKFYFKGEYKDPRKRNFTDEEYVFIEDYFETVSLSDACSNPFFENIADIEECMHLAFAHNRKRRRIEKADDGQKKKYTRETASKITANWWVKKRIMEKCNSKCMACGNPHEEELVVDHIVPVASNGTNEDDNLQILCNHCNSVKGQRSMEFLLERIKTDGTIIYQ